MGFGSATPAAATSAAGQVVILNPSGNVTPTGSITPSYLLESTTNLTNSSTYTGGFVDLSALGYARVFAAAAADVSGTLYIDFSEDGTNITVSINVATAAPSGYKTAGANFAQQGDIETVILARYCRVRYVNGGSNQGHFALSKRFSMA
jgi:hypothetical protein